MRSTLTDIAKAAGVSSATVDRVLNNREGVKQRTREIVFEAARNLGYLPGSTSTGTVLLETIKLDFILPAGTNTFIANLRDQIIKQATLNPEIDLTIHSVEGFNPDTLARALESLRGQTNGVGVIALDHPSVREAMRTLAQADVPVSQLHPIFCTFHALVTLALTIALRGVWAAIFLGASLESGRNKDRTLRWFTRISRP